MNKLIHRPVKPATRNDRHPDRRIRRVIRLVISALLNSIRVVAGPGAGKSRWGGRVLIWSHLERGSPVICLDPTGGIVANIFDKVSRQPKAVQEWLWPRIRYVDMAATDYIVPMPLYQRRRPEESLLTTANRFLEVIKRLDPHLSSASVEGWNAVYEVGTAAGMVAAALGLQITEVADLVRHPGKWKRHIGAALDQYPDDLQLAHDYFVELESIKNPVLRKRRTDSFRRKLIPLLSDRNLKATFAADSAGVDLESETAHGHLVIYDFQDEHDPERRRMKLLWTFLEIVEFAKHRGVAGRTRPILFVIDEITQLLGRDPLAQAMMSDDFNELTTVISRNYGMPLCLMHQNLSQIDERTQVSLSQIGTQLIGWVQEPADCLRLAQQFFGYDPHWVRKEQPVWMNMQDRLSSYPDPRIIDYTTTEYGLDEQIHLLSERFRTLGRFRFLLRAATGEGELSRDLVPLSIEQMDRGQYPDYDLVAEARRRLRKRDGVAIEELLAQIAARGQEQLTVRAIQGKRRKRKTEDDTIDKAQPTHEPTKPDNLQEPEPEAASVKEASTDSDNADWKLELWDKR